MATETISAAARQHFRLAVKHLLASWKAEAALAEECDLPLDFISEKLCEAAQGCEKRRGGPELLSDARISAYLRWKK